MSNFPCFKSIVQKSTQKQRSWTIVDTLFSRFGNDWDYFSHNCFCKSAQSLRSSRRNVWRVRNPSRSNGASRCGREIKFLTRAKRDQDRSAFWIVMTWLTKIFYCIRMENELKSCHNKTNWVNSVWMQDLWVLLRMDNTLGQKTLQISHNFMQWLVVNTLFQERKKRHNRKDGSEGTPRLGPYWKLQPVAYKVNMELRSELSLWTKTILTPGSEFLMDQTSLWWIWTTMSRKFQKFSSKKNV